METIGEKLEALGFRRAAGSTYIVRSYDDESSIRVSDDSQFRMNVNLTDSEAEIWVTKKGSMTDEYTKIPNIDTVEEVAMLLKLYGVEHV